MKKKYDKRDRLLPAVTVAVVGCLFCSCGSPIYRRAQIIGRKPCAIIKPEDVSACLSRNQDKKVGAISAATGCLTTPFKNLGVCGWTDYGLTAEATGRVVDARLSTDRFFTVDLRLESLRVEGTRVPNASDKFMRLEIYRPSFEAVRDSKTDGKMSARGKLVWDGDGHLEIHPKQPRDYKFLSRHTAKRS